MKTEKFMKAYKKIRKESVKPMVRIESKKTYDRKREKELCPYTSGGCCGLQMECNDCKI
jgi:hypothetical protein